jgi:putative N6-adenine-specific DNA methylase
MHELFVTCAGGFESLLARELRTLGCERPRIGFRGVYVPKEMTAVYAVNYCSRLATRVLWPLAQFPCPDKEALYRGARNVDWSSLLSLNKTFAIDANVSHPTLRHSLFAALVVKDALCDHMREASGGRPNVEIRNPDVQFHLFIYKGRATISLDTSGAPLFKRGWRKRAALAPLQESLAAGILLYSDYGEEDILCDPFCGSGTFLVEAALVLTRTPPGLFRSSWGFQHMQEFSKTAWEAVKGKADGQRRPLPPGRLCGADKDLHAVTMTRDHLRVIGCDQQVELAYADIARYTPSVRPTITVCNPPYGNRLEAHVDTYRALSRFLCAHTQGPACVLASNKALIEAIGGSPAGALPFVHGGIASAAYRLKLRI